MSNWSYPVNFIGSFIQPLFWVLLFSQLLQGASLDGVHPGMSYMTYFAPGMAAATVVLSGLWAGLGMVFDQQNGMFARLIWSSRSRTGLGIAYVVQPMTSMFVQVIAVLGLAVIMGGSFDTRLPNIAGTLIVIALLSLTMSSISHVIGIVVNNMQGVIVINSFLSLPLLFLSGILYPIDKAPQWFKIASILNPTEHGAELLKYYLIRDYNVESVAFHFTFLILLTSIFTIIFLRLVTSDARLKI